MNKSPYVVSICQYVAQLCYGLQDNSSLYVYFPIYNQCKLVGQTQYQKFVHGIRATLESQIQSCSFHPLFSSSYHQTFTTTINPDRFCASDQGSCSHHSDMLSILPDVIDPSSLLYRSRQRTNNPSRSLSAHVPPTLTIVLVDRRQPLHLYFLWIPTRSNHVNLVDYSPPPHQLPIRIVPLVIPTSTLLPTLDLTTSHDQGLT